MRILNVVNNFLPHSKAGTEYYVAELATELTARGLDINILVPAPEESGEPPGQVARRQWNRLPVDEIALGGTAVSQEQALIDYIEGLAPDVVHVHSIIGFPDRVIDILGGNGRRPVMVHLHDFHFLCANHILINNNGQVCEGPESARKCATCQALQQNRQQPAPEDIEAMAAELAHKRKTFAKLDLAISPSLFSRDTCRSWNLQARRHSVRQLGLAPFAIPADTKPADSPIVMACLGGICWFKGQDLPVTVFAALKPDNAVLELHGSVNSPPYFDHIMQVANKVDSISHHGEYGRSDLPAILTRADVVIIPSRMETFSFVLREALQAGKPVIVSDAGALKEAVEGTDFGLVFRSGDPADLAMKTKRALENPDLIRTMAGNVPAPLSISEDAAGLVDIYASLID